MGDIFFTSAVYAFKAECDMPSVASIIGYRRTMDMFRNPEKYDLYERRKSRNVGEYFDELYASLHPTSEADMVQQSRYGAAEG